MTSSHTLYGSLVATIALLVPVAAQADRYVEIYQSPPAVVYEPAPPADATVTRYWDSDRGAYVERRVIEERPAWHWVPSHREFTADGREFFVDGHWER
jgi:hypothetical protein